MTYANMKINIISTNITTKGGTERALSNLTSLLLKLNHTVKIISICSSDSDKPFYNFEGAEIVHFRFKDIPVNVILKPFWFMKTFFKLKFSFSFNSAEIFLGAGHNMNVLLPMIKPPKSKTIGCEHLVYDSYPAFTKFFVSIFYRYLDAVVVLSDTMSLKFNQINKNVRVIPNSLSFDSNKVSDLNQKKIILVGRLSKEKGYDRLILIADKLSRLATDWKFEIFGEGEMRSEIQRQISSYNLEHYLYLKGNTKNIENEYCNASILLMTSYFEAFPMVLLEAKSFGVPTVSFDCPSGPREIINDGIDGYLVDNNDINKMVEKLQKLMEDNTLRKKMGVSARQSVDKYRQCNIMKNWAELIEKL